MMQTNHNGNLTPQQRLQKNILAVITHSNYRALGGVVMLGETQVVDDCPTAATDGLNVIYGAQFISSLSDPELRFVILHEAMHKSLRHLTTWRHLWKKNPQRANAACDYVINLMLRDLDPEGKTIQMPKWDKDMPKLKIKKGDPRSGAVPPPPDKMIKVQVAADAKD